MSVKLIDRAFDLPGLTAQERVLLLVLANIADDEGRNCYPSRGYLLRKAHVVNKRSVSRLLSSLEKKGILETTPRFKDGQQRSNAYQLVGLISEGDIADDQGGVTPVTPPVSDKVVTTVTPTLSPRSPPPCHPGHPDPSRDPSRDPQPSLSSSSKTSERGAHKAIDPDFLTEMAATFPGVDVPREYAKFNDYNEAKGRRLKDNRAGFRLWLRKAEDYAANRPRVGSARVKQGMDEEAIRALREA